MVDVYKIKHSIDAKHVKNIGEQSVSSPVQAVIEMVKNSYDADADNCIVHFYAKTSLTRYLDVYKIIVEDDGIGMTFKDLENKWMRIGTESKERESYSPLYQRRVSGEKGMGHFATQKLGNKLKLVSNPKMYTNRESSKFSDRTLSLEINWEKYEPGLLFNEIENNLEVSKSDDPDKHGISIEITNLNDEWTLDDVERVQINLGNLLLPKFIRKNLKNPFHVNIVAHGFALKRDEIESTVEKYAPWEIECKLRGNMAYYTIYKLNQKNGKRFPAMHINNTAPGKGKFPIGDKTCGNAEFKLLYYRGRSTDWLPKTVVKKRDVEMQLKENCGIKIFNDGIRVMPYGEPGNDWIGLGERKVKRAGGKLRNEQSMGFVFLSRENNGEIIETTTRQALVENDAFEVLREKFVLETIECLEEYLEQAIVDKKWGEVREEPKTKAASVIRQLEEFIETLDIEPSKKKEQRKKLSEIDRLLEKQETDFEEKEEELTTNLEMYRNLASLGISALAFHHELVQPIARIEARQSMLLDKWKSWTDEKKTDYVKKSLKDVWTINDLNTYIREFAALFKGAKGTRRKREEIDIKETLKRLQKGFEQILSSHKIEIEVVPGPGSFTGLYMNMASFESIMLNLISNSIRALLKVDRTNKKIRISYQKKLGYLEIRVQDNGYGIKEDDFEKIFRPFWTTFKGDFEYGTGMGTTIVREILDDDYGGTIGVEMSTYDPNEPGKGKTTMLIRIPLDELKEK